MVVIRRMAKELGAMAIFHPAHLRHAQNQAKNVARLREQEAAAEGVVLVVLALDVVLVRVEGVKHEDQWEQVRRHQVQIPSGILMARFLKISMISHPMPAA